MAVDRDGLIKVIERAQTGSPSILASKIIESEWLKDHTDTAIDAFVEENYG